MQDFFEQKFMPVMGRLGSNPYLQAIRDGISITIPFTIIGSVFLILGNLPIEGWSDIIGDLGPMLSAAVNVTFNIIGLIAAMGLGYYFSRMHEIDIATGTILTVVTFLLATVSGEDFSLSTAAFGSSGMFTAILIAMVATGIMSVFIKRGFIIKLPDGVPPAVGKSFEALIPAAVTVVLVWVVRVIGGIDINGVLQLIFSPFVFALNTLPGALVEMLLILLLWFAGIHGNSVVGSLCTPITMTYLADNTAAMLAGTAPVYNNAEGFFYFGMGLGGTGATIGLAISLAFFMKSKQYRTLGKFTLVPSVFGINEPLMFGVPIVLNPTLLVPFVAAPILLNVASWILMDLGVIGRVVASIPWTTPPILSGFLCTGGDWRAAVWQIAEVIIATAIWLPFMKMLDRKACEEERADEIAATED